MREANVVARRQSFPEQRYGSIQIVSLHGNIAKKRQGLRVIGVNRQLALELGLRLIVVLQLPMQVAKAKMHVGLLGCGLYSFLELANGLGSPSQAVQGFA